MRLRIAVLTTAAVLLLSCATVAGSEVVISLLRGTETIAVGADRYVEPSEKLLVGFPQPVDLIAFRSAYTIDPAAPSRVYARAYGRAVEITFRKVPGTTYTVSFTGALQSAAGLPLTAPANIVVHVKPVDVQSPLRATPNEPYRYGVLAHPFPFSLGDIRCTGPGGYGGSCSLRDRSLRQIELMCDAGVRYVRIDYPAGQILNNGKRFFSTPDFTKEDAIMDELARCGITELPVILQYAAGPIMTGGKGNSSPMQWATGTGGMPGYADFARIVVQHVASKYPQITRIELFNEPNNHGWGSFPIDGDYAQRGDESGRVAATYMKAAYQAVKEAEPHMIVVGPAIADGGHSTDPRQFLETLYANGCRRGTCWDVLSVHNYDWENPTFPADHSRNRFDVYKDLQKIAAAHGDFDTHVMLTEWGFSTANDNPDAFDPQVQAAYVSIGFNKMLADPSVDGITYVNMYNAGHDFWAHTALADPDFTPKPAFYVFKQFAAR